MRITNKYQTSNLEDKVKSINDSIVNGSDISEQIWMLNRVSLTKEFLEIEFKDNELTLYSVLESKKVLPMYDVVDSKITKFNGFMDMSKQDEEEIEPRKRADQIRQSILFSIGLNDKGTVNSFYCDSNAYKSINNIPGKKFIQLYQAKETFVELLKHIINSEINKIYRRRSYSKVEPDTSNNLDLSEESLTQFIEQDDVSDFLNRVNVSLQKKIDNAHKRFKVPNGFVEINEHIANNGELTKITNGEHRYQIATEDAYYVFELSSSDYYVPRCKKLDVTTNLDNKDYMIYMYVKYDKETLRYIETGKLNYDNTSQLGVSLKNQYQSIDCSLLPLELTATPEEIKEMKGEIRSYFELPAKLRMIAPVMKITYQLTELLNKSYGLDENQIRLLIHSYRILNGTKYIENDTKPHDMLGVSKHMFKNMLEQDLLSYNLNHLRLLNLFIEKTDQINGYRLFTLVHENFNKNEIDLTYGRFERLISYFERHVNSKYFSLRKIVQYLIQVKNREFIHSLGGIVIMWLDTLDFAEKLHRDSGSKTFLNYNPYPSVLTIEHNKMNLLYQAYQRKNKMVNFVNNSRFDLIHQGKEFTIAPATCPDELISEGLALNHCVGSYVSRQENNTSSILFLRHNDNLNKSFITVEVNDNRVVQLQGRNMYAASFPQNVKTFIHEWVSRKGLELVVHL